MALLEVSAFEKSLAEHLPLEQGLRHLFHSFPAILQLLAEHLPLEQGLRPKRPTPLCTLHRELAEHLPLEQGLRLVLAVVL